MKKILLIVVGMITGVTVMTTGCSSDETSNPSADRTEARNLYLELRNHSNRYVDTLKSLSDSADVKALESRYEKGINDIYFRYPPDTDVDMTQGEQDTLWLLADRFIRLKQHRVAGLQKKL